MLSRSGYLVTSSPGGGLHGFVHQLLRRAAAEIPSMVGQGPECCRWAAGSRARRARLRWSRSPERCRSPREPRSAVGRWRRHRPARPPDQGPPRVSAAGRGSRRVVNRCQARPFVAADLAVVLATCHRPRQRVPRHWSPTRLPVWPGARAVRPRFTSRSQRTRPPANPTRASATWNSSRRRRRPPVGTCSGVAEWPIVGGSRRLRGRPITTTPRPWDCWCADALHRARPSHRPSPYRCRTFPGPLWPDRCHSNDLQVFRERHVAGRKRPY